MPQLLLIPRHWPRSPTRPTSLADLEYIHHVGVVYGRGEGRLPTEPLDVAAVGGEGGVKYLEGDDLVGFGVERTVDGPLAARGDLVENLVAPYLDEQKAIQWWHRVAVRQRGDYYLRGWKPDRIWPDFVAMAGETEGKPHLLVFETKGEHLRGNPDTEYEERVMETLQSAFNVYAGTMTIRDGPAKGTFRLVFESNSKTVLAGLDNCYRAV